MSTPPGARAPDAAEGAALATRHDQPPWITPRAEPFGSLPSAGSPCETPWVRFRRLLPRLAVLTASAGLLAAALARPASVQAGACAGPLWYPALLAPDAAIPPGGGVLVGLASYGPPLARTADALDTLALPLEVEGAEIPTTREPLAPGLVRFRPEPPIPGPATARVLAAPGVALRFVARARPLRAPRVRSVAVEDGTYGQAYVARLRGAAPAGAVAVLVLEGAEGSTALGWSAVEPRARELLLWTAGGRCAPLPPGFTALAAGATVRLAWVDAGGAVSPPSPPLVVEARSVGLLFGGG
jgi:hypothetical protein